VNVGNSNSNYWGNVNGTGVGVGAGGNIGDCLNNA